MCLSPQIFGEPAVIDPVEECALLRCTDAVRALAAAPTAPAKLHYITTGNSPDDPQWDPRRRAASGFCVRAVPPGSLQPPALCCLAGTQCHVDSTLQLKRPVQLVARYAPGVRMFIYGMCHD